MLLVDSDNALGSSRGDIDDGFAIAAVLAAKLPIGAIAAVHGNTSRDNAYRNHQALGSQFEFKGKILRESREVVEFLRTSTSGTTVLALGPLTNIAAAIADGARPREVLLVGSNLASHGRWPPLWPFEFNLTKDIRSAQRVFESEIPLTIAPLDVCRRLRLDSKRLEALRGEAGRYLRTHSTRWLKRAARLYLRSSVPVWDLVPALYLICPNRFEVAEMPCRIHANGWVQYGSGRTVRVILSYDEDSLWSCFERLLAGEVPF